MSENNIDELIQRGIEQQQSGDIAGSIATFSQILELEPEHAQGWYCKAIGLANAGQTEEAITAYQKSIEFAGEQAALPLFNLGSLYQDLGEEMLAAKCFQQATEVDPSMVDAWVNLGRILDDRQNHESAIACYDIALDVDADESMAWSNRGNSLRSLQRIEEAIDSYRRALELDSEDFAAQVGLGGCLAESGDVEAGLKMIENAIEVTGHPLALFEKATVLGKAGRNEEGAAVYDQVIGVGYRSAEIWNNRGECLAQIDRIDDALASFDEAIETNDQFGPAYFGKARVLVNAGRIDEAKPIVEKLFAIGDEELIASSAARALKELVDAG